MTRSEARFGLALALLSILGGLVWLFGPWGLLGFGVVVGAAVLLIEVKESAGEAVAGIAGSQQPGDHPVLMGPVPK